MAQRIFGYLLTIVMAVTLSAQSISDLKNVNVDELSDAQIRAYVNQAQQSGYTADQLVLIARSQGVDEIEIQKLQSRIQGLDSSSGSDVSTVPDRLRETESSTIIYEIDSDEESPIFGLSFFKNKNLTFEPSLNIPTPQNYQLGPGDELIVDIWGASEQTYQLQVSPEGTIRIPNLGPIYLNGLTIEKATTKIKSRLKSIYSTLGRNTFADVTLGSVRSIKVNVIGEVVQPGSYVISSFATAFNALYLAGGPLNSGSLREIVIFRNGKKIGAIDAYDYLIRGGAEEITLQEQDVVMVKPYITRVTVNGEVKRPAIYELLENETLAVLVDYAGGFTENAYSKSISINRNNGNFKTVVTVDQSDFSSSTMQNGDDLRIPRISGIFENRVSIRGAVHQPGTYQLSEDMMVSDLIEKAEGLRNDAFLDRAVVIRRNEDFTLSSEAFEVGKVLASEEDFPLKSEDLISIKSIFDLQEAYTVRIEGEVLSPGPFPFVENQTVEDLIYLAGGFKESAARSQVEVARRIDLDSIPNLNAASDIYTFEISPELKLDENASNFILEPYDLVIIRENPYFENRSMVKVEGEVLFPGNYALQKKNERISEIIQRTGGLTDIAYPKGATLIRLTEYFDEGADADVKKETITQLGIRDTTTDQSSFAIKRKEAIAIELEEIMKNPGSAFDLFVKKGDVIGIPKTLQTVRIRGEVLYPSNIVYSNKGFRDFISESGGTTDQARLKKSYIVYANGSAGRVKSFLWFKIYPKVEPGAEIIVPAKPERRRLSPQEVIGLTTSIATLALIVDRLIK